MTLPCFSDAGEFLLHFSKRFGLSKKKVRTVWQQQATVKKVSQKHKLSRQPQKYSGTKGSRKNAAQRRYYTSLMRGC